MYFGQIRQDPGDAVLVNLPTVLGLLTRQLPDSLHLANEPDEFGQNTIVSNFFVFQFYLKSLKPEINYG